MFMQTSNENDFNVIFKIEGQIHKQRIEVLLIIHFGDHLYVLQYSSINLMSAIKKKTRYDRTAEKIQTKFLTSSICINSRFIVQNFKQKCDEYFLYEGIDKLNYKWVNIYLKPVINSSSREKIITFCQKGRNKLKKLSFALRLYKPQKFKYKILFFYMKYIKDLVLLQIQCLKPLKVMSMIDNYFIFFWNQLIEKINNLKLVCGELSLNSIIFDSNPRRNELFLSNSFKLQRKRPGRLVVPSTYCSKGVHLGRKVGIKDDLQSICYILIEVYANGQFLADLQIKDCMSLKITQKIQDFAKGLPPVFIDFYHYVISLNYEEQINFFYWKSHLSRILTPKVLYQPYGFLINRSKNKEGQQYEQFDESQIGELQDFSEHQTTIKQAKISKIQRSLSMKND